ncbi:tetratricopeptide repeat-containing sensor histidine kinase [Kordia sp.]|uniref:tetratricopeptide repeat-containing sensor histidine kinase n=1 Tax=Kordia sp. TaxID=1965332 RepID=UPI003B5CEC74
MTLKTISFFFLLLCFNLSGQNQKKADSLKHIFNEREIVSDSIATQLIAQIIVKSSSPEEILIYSDVLLQRSKQYKPIFYAIKAHNAKGVAYRLKGNLENSLKSLFKSASLASDNEYPVFEAEAYSEISNTYIANDDFSNSLIYQTKAIDIFRKQKINKRLCVALLNTGFNYYSIGELDTALQLYNEAAPIFDEVKMSIGKAYTIGNRALVYWKQGDFLKAEEGLFKAIHMLESLGDQFGMADYHNQLGSIYLEQNKIKETIFHTQKSLEMSENIGLKEQIRDASLLLSKLYTKKKDYKEALKYQAQYIVYKDSVQNKEQTRKIADIRTNFEVNLREKEIDLLEKREKLNTYYIIIAFILLILSITILFYFRQRFKTTKLIAFHQKKEHNDKIKNLLKSHETKVLQSIIQGKDNEKKRLAKELHNHFGSLLATIKVNVSRIEEHVIPNYKTLTDLVDKACTDIRNMSHSLHLGISEDFGLIHALRELRIHLEQSKELSVEFSASIDDGIIDFENEIIIYRIIQELVSNVLKHAKATKLSISLTFFSEESLINILVNDNGQGFDTEKEFHGMGLKSIKEIVTQHNGILSFDSNSVSGTTVNIDLPVTIKTNLI